MHVFISNWFILYSLFTSCWKSRIRKTRHLCSRGEFPELSIRLAVLSRWRWKLLMDFQISFLVVMEGMEAPGRQRLTWCGVSGNLFSTKFMEHFVINSRWRFSIDVVRCIMVLTKLLPIWNSNIVWVEHVRVFLWHEANKNFCQFLARNQDQHGSSTLQSSFTRSSTYERSQFWM